MPREGRLDAPHTGPRRALLPHLHRVVPTPGDEASIRKDRHAKHEMAVPREGRLDAPHTGPRRALLPHLHRVVELPVTKRPSARTATQYTSLLCPVRVATGRPGAVKSGSLKGMVSILAMSRAGRMPLTI